MELQFLCSKNTTDDKAFRLIHGAIELGGSLVTIACIEYRARHLLAPLHAEASRAIQRNMSNAKKRLATKGVPYAQLEEAASCEPPSEICHQLSKVVGTNYEEPKKNFDLFLQRRHRADWARTTRKESVGTLFCDPLMLSLLRKVSADKAQASMDFLLAMSSIAVSPENAQAATTLGANPLSRSPIEGSGLDKLHRHNALGQILMRCPFDTFNAAIFSGGPTNHSDEHILASALCVLACVDSQRLPELLSLAVHKSKTLPERDALGLAFQLGLLNCAIYFTSLGMDASAPSAGNFQDSLNDPHLTPTRRQALAGAYANAQKKCLSLGLPEEQALDPSCADSKPRAPRL